MALAIAFLIVALVAATVGYVQTSASLAVAERAKRQSDESFRQARSAVDRFFTRFSETELLDQPGMQPLRRALLEDAITYYEQFLVQRGDDPTIRDELAAAHFRVGRIRELIGAPEEALQAYRQARTMQQQLVNERPDDQSRLAALGETANGIGRVLHRTEDFQAALDAYGEAAEARQRLATLAPDVPEYQRTLANTYMNIGLTERLRDLVRAREQFEKAQTIRQKLVASDPKAAKVQCDLAMGHFNFAILEIYAVDRAAAERHLRGAIRIFEKLLETNPGRLGNKSRLATCYRVLADLKAEMGETDDALTWYEQSRGQMMLLVLTNPDVAEYRATLAGLHMNVGLLHRELDQTEAALAAFADALDLLEQLVRDFPATPSYRWDLAVALRETGQLSVRSDRAESRRNLEAAIGHLEQLVELSPDDEQFRSELQATRQLLKALTVPADERD
jgi:tetratricopeptide (TPR) repeat protein